MNLPQRSLSISLMFASLIGFCQLPTPTFAKRKATTSIETENNLKIEKNLRGSESKPTNTIPKSEIKKRRRPPVATNRLLKVVYGLPAWNQSSTEIDYATIFMKDAKSQRLVQIRLEETEPDSATFEGQFAISWGSVEDIIPELYVADKEIKDPKEMVAFINKINKRDVRRKPFVLRKGERGEQIIDVYDTRQQAVAAMKAYREAQRLKKLANTPAPQQPLVAKNKEAVLEAEKLAQMKAAEEALALEAAQREIERVRLEQLEKQRAEERRKAQEAMKVAEKEARKRDAADLAEKAMSAYQAGDFKGAEELFAKSVNLDPNNTSYYFRYGVTLYKNEKFNQSLVILNAAQVEGNDAIERDFYVALNHYRLNENESALKMLAKVRDAKVLPSSPSAAFYEGVIYFSQAKYDPAQSAFQIVLDTSDNPKLDERAEEYIENIARIKNFQANKAKTFLFEGTLGGMYDSNVLQQADSTADQGTATNKGSPRMVLSGSIEYRPVYEAQHEASIKTSVSNIYTADETLSATDPLLLGVSLPYKYKGTAWSKGYQLTVEPLYEHLQMPVGTDSLDSGVVTFDNTFVMSKLWFSSYKLVVRKDNSLSSTATGADSLSALKVTLSSEQSYFRDKERKTATLSKVGLAFNSAEGANNSYQRFDLGIGYMNPWKWSTTLISKLDMYYLNYDQRSTPRADSNFTLSLTMAKPINDWSSWASVLAYTLNNSTEDSSTYNKLALTLVYAVKGGL